MKIVAEDLISENLKTEVATRVRGKIKGSVEEKKSVNTIESIDPRVDVSVFPSTK